MKKRAANVLLTLLTVVLLCFFALSVSDGRVSDEKDEMYRDMIEAMEEE